MRNSEALFHKLFNMAGLLSALKAYLTRIWELEAFLFWRGFSFCFCRGFDMNKFHFNP